MSNIRDREGFAQHYAGHAPWDIGKPQHALVEIADQIRGPLLDAGCGTGDTSIFFAARGLEVTGIDFVDVAIQRATVKAKDRGVRVEFLVKDATELHAWNRRFESVIDCGLLHVFSNDDRRDYVNGLTLVTNPGGMLYLMCFSDEEPGEYGPRRISKREIHDSFADGWSVESIEPVLVDTNRDIPDLPFSKSGPKAWLAKIRRTE